MPTQVANVTPVPSDRSAVQRLQVPPRHPSRWRRYCLRWRLPPVRVPPPPSDLPGVVRGVSRCLPLPRSRARRDQGARPRRRVVSFVLVLDLSRGGRDRRAWKWHSHCARTHACSPWFTRTLAGRPGITPGGLHTARHYTLDTTRHAHWQAAAAIGSARASAATVCTMVHVHTWQGPGLASWQAPHRCHH